MVNLLLHPNLLRGQQGAVRLPAVVRGESAHRNKRENHQDSAEYELILALAEAVVDVEGVASARYYLQHSSIVRDQAKRALCSTLISHAGATSVSLAVSLRSECMDSA